MIKLITMYTIVCDNCGRDIFEDDDQWRAFSDTESAVIMAIDNDSIQIIDNKHICSNCWTWDENDEIIIKPKKDKL